MFRKLTLFSVVLTLIILVLGSLVRLANVEPGGFTPDLITILNGTVHQYLTTTLGLSVLILTLTAWRQQQGKLAAILTSLFVLVLVIVQAALGLSAKVVLNMPLVITSHVLLGMLTFWLLFGLYLRANPSAVEPIKVNEGRRQGLILLTRFAMLVLGIQIILGVWVSANHAASACAGFPQCNGLWWPEGDYAGALDLTRGIFTGDFGVISPDAWIAVNWLHRVGTLLVFVLLSAVMFGATAINSLKSVRTAGLWLGGLLFTLIGFTIISAKLSLPLWFVSIHQGLAVILMLPLLAISFYSRYGRVKTDPVDAIHSQPQQERVVSFEAKFEPPYEEPLPESLYLRLKSQLKRTRSGLSGLLSSLPLGSKEVNDELLEEIEANLLMADVGIDATTEIIRHLTNSLEKHQLTDGEALSTALKYELLSILKPCSLPLEIPVQDTPFVILVVGVNGAGKTTTIGKLAKRLQAQGNSVMLAAGDTFRAAAVEQLQVWGERNGIPVVAQHTGADSASVIYDGLQSAKAKGIDVLIADTAGRLHTKSNLMEELKKVKRIMGKLDEAAPHEVLLVLDAGTGQNALSQAKLFNETVALTGLVLTKLDGTAKGGVIFALAKHTGIPIRFIGIGEGIDDLQDFDAELFVNALFVKD
ncbi:MAG: signal recognition particle-docking protein FtsY [Methylococcales bacterium]|nr:MAG: signal recognition particle-docking protein FtsY [Methylococcales bacterium]